MSSSGYRLKRADPFIRTAYARAYRLALNIFYRLGVRDVDCAFKLFKRSALEGIRLESGGAFMSAELLIKLKQRGRRIAEVGVPHYPRTAGSPTGAKPSVIFRAMRDFWTPARPPVDQPDERAQARRAGGRRKASPRASRVGVPRPARRADRR